MLCKCSGKYIDIYFNLKITYLYIIRSAFYVFSLKSGGGGTGELNFRFAVLLRPVLFLYIL